jgi:hypothetical protein
MSEGFQASKLLSRKFVVLYKLCEDLLSKSRWGTAPAVGRRGGVCGLVTELC